MPRDNYEILKENARKYFLTFDRDEIRKKPFLSHDDDYCYMQLCGQKCRVRWETGFVETQNEKGSWEEAGANAAMTVYDLLCYSRADAAASGKYVSLRQLSSLFTVTETSYYASYAAWFDRRQKLLTEACLALGGQPSEYAGDLAYRLPLTDFIGVVLQFWGSDDEFPPVLTLLMDSNILSFMHFETVWYVMGQLLHRLKETAENL